MAKGSTIIETMGDNWIGIIFFALILMVLLLVLTRPGLEKNIVVVPGMVALAPLAKRKKGSLDISLLLLVVTIIAVAVISFMIYNYFEPNAQKTAAGGISGIGTAISNGVYDSIHGVFG